MTSPSDLPTPEEMDRAFLRYQNEMWWARMQESDREVSPVNPQPIPRGCGFPDQEEDK